jgi:hypothetical protein
MHSAYTYPHSHPISPVSQYREPEHLLDGHGLSISFARLDGLAGLLDGGEDGLVGKGVVLCDDLGGLVLEGNVVFLDTCIRDGLVIVPGEIY